VDALWAMMSEGVRLNVRAISIQDSQSTNVTDRQADDGHAIPIPNKIQWDFWLGFSLCVTSLTVCSLSNIEM